MIPFKIEVSGKTPAKKVTAKIALYSIVAGDPIDLYSKDRTFVTMTAPVLFPGLPVGPFAVNMQGKKRT